MADIGKIFAEYWQKTARPGPICQAWDLQPWVPERPSFYQTCVLFYTAFFAKIYRDFNLSI